RYSPGWARSLRSTMGKVPMMVGELGARGSRFSVTGVDQRSANIGARGDAEVPGNHPETAQATTLDEPSDAGDGCPRRKSRLALLLGVLAVSLVLLAAVTFTLPYYAVAPGLVLPVDDLLDVPEDRTYPTSPGTISLTTVSLRSLTAFEAVRGWLHPDIDVVPAPRVLGAPLNEESEENFAEQGQLSMGQSKDLAVLAALGRLGLLAERGNGALVSAVAEGSPAEGRLRQGDVLVAVDGRPTPVAGDLPAAIAARQPGETVRLDVVDTDGTPRTEEIVLRPSPHWARSGGRSTRCLPRRRSRAATSHLAHP
ncbi:MAG TPA: PDZ domain-containing protein, partial [Acidimicrobiales bacterium]|nr:PDZ domain-containing protein [Acidimicrobiales bacterium]